MTSDHSQPESRPDPGTITQLLEKARDGDEDALDQAWTLLYNELRVLAHNLMRGDALEKQVDATELLGEIWLRGHKEQELPKDRTQFFGRAFRHMAQELIDYARKRNAAKRGGGWKKRPLGVVAGELSSIQDFDDEKKAAAAALMEHWGELNERFPVAGNVSFCRLVLDLSNDDTARTLDLEPASAKREWYFARAKLREALGTSGHAP